MLKVFKFVFATIACLTFSKPVFAESMTADGGPSRNQSTGLALYRVADLGATTVAPAPLVEKGNEAASRIRGAAAIDREECNTEKSSGIEVLKNAARLGDTSALISLEKMRIAKSPLAPSLEEMVSIEYNRAIILNDRVSAWRLTKRFDAGESTVLTNEDYIDLLKIAAADQSWPKAGEAAWKLCEALAHDKAVSRDWCEKASAHLRLGASIAFMHRRANDG